MTNEKMFENLELHWLLKNYVAVETINKTYKIKSISDYTLKDWNENIKTISFSKDSKLGKPAINGILINLKNLECIDLESYDCNYDITLQEINLLKKHNISVRLNRSKKYTESEINKIINIDRYDSLIREKNLLYEQIEYIDAMISRLGIHEGVLK